VLDLSLRGLEKMVLSRLNGEWEFQIGSNCWGRGSLAIRKRPKNKTLIKLRGVHGTGINYGEEMA